MIWRLVCDLLQCSFDLELTNILYNAKRLPREFKLFNSYIMLVYGLWSLQRFGSWKQLLLTEPEVRYWASQQRRPDFF